MGGGYLLKSEDCMSSGSLCGAWLQRSPSQHWISRSEEIDVAFSTSCPSLHWSNFTKVWPTVGYHALKTLVAHKLEHREAEGEELHSMQTLGCSKKEAVGKEQFCFINVVRNIWRRMSKLSPSTSSCSAVVKVGNPHTNSSDLPLTGIGALGFGNQRRIDHVRQFGGPHKPISLCPQWLLRKAYHTAGPPISHGPTAEAISWCQKPPHVATIVDNGHEGNCPTKGGHPY